MKLTKLKSAGIKDGHEYFTDEFGTLFCDAIDQSQKVGGQAEEERNAIHNHGRLSRITALAPFGAVADFGCGSGLFVDYARAHGVKCDGYDPFSERFAKPLAPLQYDLVMAIEVIEHLSEPFNEFAEMSRLLTTGGIVMLESSFSDFIGIQGDYCNPQLGHSTIWSHAGLDATMKEFGFAPGEHINRNVRIYKKL